MWCCHCPLPVELGHLNLLPQWCVTVPAVHQQPWKLTKGLIFIGFHYLGMDQIIGWPRDWIQSQFPFCQSGWYHKVQSPNPLIMWWVFMRWAAPILSHTVIINYQSPPQITKTFHGICGIPRFRVSLSGTLEKGQLLVYSLLFRTLTKTDHQTAKAFIVPSKEIGLLLHKNVMLMWSLFIWSCVFSPTVMTNFSIFKYFWNKWHILPLALEETRFLSQLFMHSSFSSVTFLQILILFHIVLSSLGNNLLFQVTSLILLLPKRTEEW